MEKQTVGPGIPPTNICLYTPRQKSLPRTLFSFEKAKSGKRPLFFYTNTKSEKMQEKSEKKQRICGLLYVYTQCVQTMHKILYMAPRETFGRGYYFDVHGFLWDSE
ncbi:MAG: hypothetical protein IJT44_00650 [Clostridia bacterium]|nr:hypothetical protein [Clostridia bacterium]